MGALKAQYVDVQTIEGAAAEWGKRVSPKTVNKILTTLTAVLALAKRYKLLKENPGHEAERFKVATEDESTFEVSRERV